MSDEARVRAHTERPESHSSSESLVKCTNVSHEYVRGKHSSLLPWRGGQSSTVTTALRDVSVTVDGGQTVGMAGPSGSGKSTLLHLIAGLLTPTEGTILLAGTDLTTLSPAERTAVRHRHVGLVFQRFHLLPSLSARANVALPLVEAGVSRSKRRTRAKALLERVGLGDRVDHRPAQLSGGEQQRVAIARALVRDPDVILADEPTGELDSETGEQVLDVLTDVTDDQAVVLASHDEAALAVADRVYRLHDGRIMTGSDNGI